jgi:hypothetical protein
MEAKIAELLGSLKPDLIDANLREKTEKALTSLSAGNLKDAQTACDEISNFYSDQSTVTIRLKIAEKMIHHLMMEKELETLLKKEASELSEAELKRVEQIAGLVEKSLENFN